MKTMPKDMNIIYNEIGDVLEDETITALSNWKEINTDNSVDYDQYLERAAHNIEVFKSKFADQIHNQLVER